MKQIIENQIGKQILLMGNVAIVRGAIEAGVGFASTYPGTPASEIGDTFAEIASLLGIYFEYSINEKVALEAAAGASFAGIRALCSMKHVGVNVAADPLFSLAYTGIDGGLVIVSVDDPSCWSSQNEQDNRHYAVHAGLNMLEPSSSQEALEMTKNAFDISEKIKEPLFLRTTTRIAHTYNKVSFGPIQKRKKPNFERRISRVTIPKNARPAHQRLLENLKIAETISEKSKFNKTTMGDRDLGIITSGVAYSYSMDALRWLNIDASILKLGMTYPLPKKTIIEFIKNVNNVLVVEELDPWLETHIRAIAQANALDVPIFGKEQQLLPRVLELSIKDVAKALSNVTKKPLPIGYTEANEKSKAFRELIVSRPPQFCAGCPHRASYYAIKKAIDNNQVVVGSDIGCYGLGINPPFNSGDWQFCMGASIGVACGVAHFIEEPILVVIGDSTFFHAGIPALINAVRNDVHLTLFVFDNLSTAMTGHQPNPGSEIGEKHGNVVKIEDIVRGCGVKDIHIIDPYKTNENIRVIQQAINYNSVSVVIFRRACALVITRIKRKKGLKTIPAKVDPEKCQSCRTCIEEFGCIAFVWDNTTNQMRTDEVLCDGCGVCLNVCPHYAIYKKT